jgi:hypothetical protein
MRALLKIGFGLLMLSFVLTGVAYLVLRNHAVLGAGNPEGRLLASETRQVSKAVTTVDLGGSIDLTVRYGPEPSLTVRGEQRLLGNIETSQDGNRLHIAPRGLVLSHRHPLQAVLVLPSLASVTINGNGDTTVDGFSGDAVQLQVNGSGTFKFNGRYRRVSAGLNGSGDMDLDVGNSDRVDAHLMGSGDMTLAGACAELMAEVTGSGSLNAQHLRAETVNLRQFGTADSTINARKSVAATVSGNGDVTVHGNPEQRNVTRSGNGEVVFND